MSPSLLLLLPAAWAATGSISVVGEDDFGERVRGGQVMLDGFPTGEQIPVTLENVPTGAHRVSVKIGCGQGEAPATVGKDKTAKVVVKLEETDGVGTVRLKGLPEGARVRLDADEVDAAKGSFETTCGAHKLRVSAPGFAPWEQDIVVTVDEWVAVGVELERGEMGDGGGGIAGGARTGGFFEGVIEDDFSFDDGGDFDADEGDDAFLSAAPTPAVRGERTSGTSSDSFLADDDGGGDDGYVPPSVALALAGGDLSTAPGPGSKPGAAPEAERPPKAERPVREPRPEEAEEAPREPREPRPPREKAARPPRAEGGGPSLGQWIAVGGASAVTIGGLGYALVQNGQVKAEQRAWEAAVYGAQGGAIIGPAYDRLEAAKVRRTVGWVTMGVGLAGVAGSTTWILLSGDKDGAAFAVGGAF